MGTKKKFCNVSLYIDLVISLLVCCITLLLTSCSYAVTISDIKDSLDYLNAVADSNTNCGYYYKKWFNDVGYNSLLTSISNNLTLSNYGFYSIAFVRTVSTPASINDFNLVIKLFPTINWTNTKAKYNGSLLWTNNGGYGKDMSNVRITYYPSNNTTGYNRNGYDQGIYYAIYGGNNIFFTNDVQAYINSSNQSTDYETVKQSFLSNNDYYFNGIEDLSSIILTATSNHKFGFTSRNQLFVEFSGDWTTSDFTFYIQKLNGSNWETVTNYNDYSILTGYDNPYYIFWADINYLPVGTYRYVADYGSLGTDLYYSNNFEITSSYIEDNVSGTITDNGNGNSSIDINIDSGNSVDNVKDFLGSPADISDLDINSDTIHEAIGLQNQVNPYDNFVLTFFSGLTGALTTVTPQQFRYQVHDWGPIRNVSVADITPQYSYGMASFLSTVSSLVVVFVIVKWTTSIIESLNSADVSRTLELVEEKYSDLF